MEAELEQFTAIYDKAAELAAREEVPVHDVLDRFFAFLQIRQFMAREEDDLLTTNAFTD